MRHFITSCTCVLFAVALVACGSSPLDAGITGSCSAKIRSERWVDVDGARLYLLLRGNRCRTPILLLLHGGPGAAERPLFRLYDHALEKKFLVAYLDQRGAGRSWDREADPKELTIARHVKDLEQVVAHLRRSHPDRPLILIGHSWGSALGLIFAAEYPEDIRAVIAVNPLVNMRASQKAQIDFVRAHARRRDDDSSLAELEKIGPPPFTGPEMLAMQKLVGRFGGEFHNRPSFLKATLLGMLKGYETLPGLRRLIEANESSVAAMADELAGLKLDAQTTPLKVPLLLMVGRYDHILPPEEAIAFGRSQRSTTVETIWFEGSAHNIPFEQPEAFVAAVTRYAEAAGLDPVEPDMSARPEVRSKLFADPRK